MPRGFNLLDQDVPNVLPPYELQSRGGKVGPKNISQCSQLFADISPVAHLVETLIEDGLEEGVKSLESRAQGQSKMTRGGLERGTEVFEKAGCGLIRLPR